MAKVLKIDVTVDENGAARRNLTDIEGGLKKVGQTASEFAAERVAVLDAKFAKLDETLDESISLTDKLRESRENHDNQAARSTSVIGDLTKAVVAYISIQGVVGAIRSTTEWAGSLEGLSARLKVPVDDLQRLSYAAQQNGVSFGTVTSALGTLEQRVGSNKSGAAGAMNEMGIAFQNVRGSDPIALFTQIGDAVSGIEDPYQRAQRAQALFGGQGNELVPLLTSNLRAMMQAADDAGAVMDSGLATRAAAADRTITNLTTHGKVLLAEFLDPLSAALTNLEGHNWRGLSDNLWTLLSRTPQGQLAGMQNQTNEPGLADLFGDDPKALPPPAHLKPPAPARLSDDPAGFFDPNTGAVSSELARQEQYLAHELSLQNEIARIEKERERVIFQSGEDLRRVLEASKAAFDNEIAGKFMENLRNIKQETYNIRDAFLAVALSKQDLTGDGVGDMAKVTADQKYQRQVEGVDTRAGNAAELIRRFEAERQMAILQAKQGAEGMTTAMADEFNAFRIQFSDIIGTLPVEFQGIVPDVLASSAALRNGLTADMSAVRARQDDAIQGYILIAQTAEQAADTAARLSATDKRLADAGWFVNIDPNVSKIREQQTGGRLFAAGGYVEPRYLAGGGSAGTDTVPAMLTPGEGVLSRTGMRALDQLNAGGGLGSKSGASSVAITIDARGAQFADDAALDRLADKLSRVMLQRSGVAVRGTL